MKRRGVALRSYGRRSGRRSGRLRGRAGPGHAGKGEEIPQLGLRRILCREVLAVPDKAILDEPDDCRVIHRDMRDIVSPSEGRDHHVRHTESNLRAKAVTRWRECWLPCGISIV